MRGDMFIATGSFAWFRTGRFLRWHGKWKYRCIPAWTRYASELIVVVNPPVIILVKKRQEWEIYWKVDHSSIECLQSLFRKRVETTPRTKATNISTGLVRTVVSNLRRLKLHNSQAEWTNGLAGFADEIKFALWWVAAVMIAFQVNGFCFHRCSELQVSGITTNGICGSM